MTLPSLVALGLSNRAYYSFLYLASIGVPLGIAAWLFLRRLAREAGKKPLAVKRI